MKLLKRGCFLIILVLAGCSTAKPIVQPEIQTTISFPPDYRGKPLNNAQTWNEYYAGGTYLFNQGKYKLACDYFLKGADRAKGEARQTCLAAAALSALGAGDQRFLEIRHTLNFEKQVNSFTRETITDKAAKALDGINCHYREEDL